MAPLVTMKGASVGYLPQEGPSLSGRTAHKLSKPRHTSLEDAQVADRFHRAEGEFRGRDGFAVLAVRNGPDGLMDFFLEPPNER
jgi:hypothetical protein